MVMLLLRKMAGSKDVLTELELGNSFVDVNELKIVEAI